MESQWVKKEIEIAWRFRSDSLVPVRLCPIEDVQKWTREQGVKPDIAQLFPVLDFSEWRTPERYEHALRLLLKSFAGGVDFRS
jgi:hypothetical protein